MSSSDVSLASSSSEFTDIDEEADYDLEVEGSPSSSTQGSDREREEVYADEPLADEEWFARYEEERMLEEELQKKLENRLSGTEKVREWYRKLCPSCM